LAKLNDGVKFDEVAREFSEDKARQGGSLGWKTKGSLDPKFEEVAFALETSTTASPKFVEVKTEFGYHIIMVSFDSTWKGLGVSSNSVFRLKDESRWRYRDQSNMSITRRTHSHTQTQSTLNVQ
jgi:transketolase